MKVKELIEKLKTVDPELEIILQKDGEGNGYHFVDGVDVCLFSNDDDDELEIYDNDWTAEDADMEEEEWQDFKTDCCEQCLVIYP